MRNPARIDRRVLSVLSRVLFARRTGLPPGPQGPRRLLLVRVDERVGNLIMLQSLIDAVKHVWPQVQVGLMASARASQVTQALQGLAHLHAIDKRWFLTRPARWRRVIAQVRAAAYEVAIDASAWHEFSFTHAALTFYSGAPVRLGFDHGVGGYHSHRILPGPQDEHELRQRMRLLQPLGVVMEPPPLRTALGMAQQAHFRRWLEERQAARPVLGVWAGSRKLERRWPLGYYELLLQKLLAAGVGSGIVLWGPGEESVRDRLLRTPGPALHAAPRTSLEELAGLLRNLDLLVTNDTGPMHLAVAAGTPTVALFASGEPGRWGHPYPKMRALHAPGQAVAEVEQVLAACQELLALTGTDGAR